MILHTVILIVHVFLALAIIGLVLMQRGKGAEAGAAFGAGASGTVFGASGSANFLSHTTAVLATLFFLTSLALAYLARDVRVPDSIVDQAAQSQVLPTPEQPAAEQNALPAEQPPVTSEQPVANTAEATDSTDTKTSETGAKEPPAASETGSK